MAFLDYSHNPWLVVLSLVVALMAGFTGLSLTQGLSQRSDLHKKISIVLASVALGGGIWSMHFVAMLGLQLPLLFYYDAAITLMSALIAILVVGVALLLLHFRPRTTGTLVLAGLIVGIGVLAMHYVGMAGLELCRAVYTPFGIVSAAIGSCILNIAAFSIAYGKRSHRNIMLGTVCFGLAVFAVHFTAIAGTNFVAVPSGDHPGPLIGNETLALGVVLTSFILCGAFLLTGVSFLGTARKPQTEPPLTKPESAATTIPYESEGRTMFVTHDAVAAIRAEGHYTQIYTKTGRYFCPWSISEAEKRLCPVPLLKTHRSYLINPARVVSFERHKDNGVCYFETPGLAKVPVSRSRLNDVRQALGI